MLNQKLKNKNHGKGFRRLKPAFLVFVFLGLIFSGISWAQEKPAADYAVISQLIEKAADFEGQTVMIKGEAVGDLMKRSDGVWLNITDGTAIGVFFEKEKITPAQVAAAVKNLGDYQNQGDTLEITGIFNKACRYHQGETDIHAVSFRVVSPGEKINHPISQGKLSLAVFLFWGTLGVVFLAWLNKKIRKTVLSK